MATKKKRSSPLTSRALSKNHALTGAIFILLVILTGFIILTSRAATPQQVSARGNLYGITIENPQQIDKIVESIKNLSWKPTVRIVFQAEDSNPSTYIAYLQKLKPYATIMGEILDSEAMQDMSEPVYQKRVNDYVGQLDQYVDIWEIGNEINGSWLGDNNLRSRNVGYAYDAVRAKNKPTALTTWFDPPSCVDPSYEMIKWNKQYIPERVKSGVSYALVSYYGSSCKSYNQQVNGSPHTWDDFEHLTTSQWTTVFQNMRSVFPSAKLGFGEVGYQNDTPAFEGPGNTKMSDIEKVRLIKEYYGLKISIPGYIGGYFYWEGSQDLVPKGNPIWVGLNEALDLQARALGDTSTTTTPLTTPSMTPTPSPTPTKAPTPSVTPTSTPVNTKTPTPTPLPATPAPTSSPTPDKTPPTTPTGLSLTFSYDFFRGSYNLRTTWQVSRDNVDTTVQYRIIRNNAVISQLSTSSYADYSIQPDTPYTYQVIAYDKAQNSSAASVPVSTAIRCFFIFCGMQ